MATTRPPFERLSALDASFLDLEGTGTHMHVGAVTVFAGTTPDIDQVRSYVAALLDRMPRYRQRLTSVPLLAHPVWIDDARFDVTKHVTSIDIGPDASDTDLFQVAGRIYSTRMDRRRPLWRLCLVTGLAGERFAAIFKIHHCMMDGVAGAGLLERLFHGVASTDLPSGSTWTPRREPTRRQLLAAELRHRGASLRHLAGDLLAAARSASSRAAARHTTKSIFDAVATGMSAAPETPFNPDQVGLERCFSGCRVDLLRLKEVKNALGGTVNDVVLAMVTGALRRQLLRHGDDPARFTGFRAMIPKNIRAASDRSLGNHVGMLLAELPIGEADPAKRLAAIREVTRGLKEDTGQATASRLIEAVSDATTSVLVTQMVRMAVGRRGFNVVVTNVPGPPFELYMLGARLEAIYPLVNLYHNQAVAFAMFSYAGSMFCGVHGARDIAPDLDTVTSDLCAELDELCEAAEPGGDRHTVAAI